MLCTLVFTCRADICIPPPPRGAQTFKSCNRSLDLKNIPPNTLADSDTYWELSFYAYKINPDPNLTVIIPIIYWIHTELQRSKGVKYRVVSQVNIGWSKLDQMSGKYLKSRPLFGQLSAHGKYNMRDTYKKYKIPFVSTYSYINKSGS